MGDVKELQTYLACPRCDKTPLAFDDGRFRCEACKTGFPDIDGIPWLFAEPDASLGEWRNRLQFALQQLGHEIAGLDVELKDKDLSPIRSYYLADEAAVPAAQAAVAAQGKAKA